MNFYGNTLDCNMPNGYYVEYNIYHIPPVKLKHIYYMKVVDGLFHSIGSLDNRYYAINDIINHIGKSWYYKLDDDETFKHILMEFV